MTLTPDDRAGLRKLLEAANSLHVSAVGVCERLEEGAISNCASSPPVMRRT